MEDKEGSLGDNVRRFREAAGMSQAELAEALTTAGTPGMYSQTIAKIEGGSRALKFAEGVALARILGVRAEQLASPDPAAVAAARLNRAEKDVSRAYGVIERSTVELLGAQRELSDRVKNGREAPRYAIERAEAAAQQTPEGAVRDGRAYFEEFGTGFIDPEAYSDWKRGK